MKKTNSNMMKIMKTLLSKMYKNISKNLIDRFETSEGKEIMNSKIFSIK